MVTCITSFVKKDIYFARVRVSAHRNVMANCVYVEYLRACVIIKQWRRSLCRHTESYWILFSMYDGNQNHQIGDLAKHTWLFFRNAKRNLQEKKYLSTNIISLYKIAVFWVMAPWKFCPTKPYGVITLNTCQSALQPWVSLGLLYNQSPPGVRFLNKIIFLQNGIVSPMPNPHPGGSGSLS
jgi:hypothetical protein